MLHLTLVHIIDALQICSFRYLTWYLLEMCGLSKFAGTGKERNAFLFKKDLSRSHFFRFFSFLERGLSSLSYLSWD